jgi:hypothetical protein
VREGGREGEIYKDRKIDVKRKREDEKEKTVEIKILWQ